MSKRRRYSDDRPARRRRGGGPSAAVWLSIIGCIALIAIVVVVVVGIQRSGARGGTTSSDKSAPGNALPTGDVVDQAHFDRLRKGMTEEQVVAIMGKPTGIDNYDDAQGKSRQLSWRKGEDFITVAFFNGLSHFPTAKFGGYYLFGRN